MISNKCRLEGDCDWYAVIPSNDKVQPNTIRTTWYIDVPSQAKTGEKLPHLCSPPAPDILQVKYHDRLPWSTGFGRCYGFWGRLWTSERIWKMVATIQVNIRVAIWVGHAMHGNNSQLFQTQCNSLPVRFALFIDSFSESSPAHRLHGEYKGSVIACVAYQHNDSHVEWTSCIQHQQHTGVRPLRGTRHQACYNWWLQ